MALSLYLDDCAFSHELADRLRQAGHAVTVPVDVGLTGADDPLHFALAVNRGLVLLTKNPRDFFALHKQCRDQNQSHPGILAVHQDNDPGRDMSDAAIVAAIASLETVYAQTGITLVNDYQSLNDWRVSIPTSSTPTAPPRVTPPASKPGASQQKPKGNK